MKSGYIVFFDSGIGGLTLLKECDKRLNGENFLYYGDNLNAPYGNKSKKQIEKLVFSAFDYLSRFPIKAAVIACNTVTAECALKMRKKYPFKIIGVEPAIKPASESCKNVLVIATRATLKSKKFNDLYKGIKTDCKFTFYAPEGLVLEIEKNIFDLSKIKLSEYLPSGNFDGVVLGCTHFVFLKERIRNYLKSAVFDGNIGTADHLAKTLCDYDCETYVNGKKAPFDYRFCRLDERDCDDKNSLCFLGKSAKINKAVYSVFM